MVIFNTYRPDYMYIICTCTVIWKIISVYIYTHVQSWPELNGVVLY